MRKVASGLFISLDGVTEAPDQWQFDVFDEDMGAVMAAYLATEDTILLGRKTYQEWADYWPNSDDPYYGTHINSTPKHVFSRTLKEASWGNWENITLVKSSLAEEVARLKALPGQTIGVAGSPGLVRSLLQADLLDELILMFHPVIVGHGKRLFDGWSDLKEEDLV